jgi:GNAT superfamily N-acetyltransferase
MLSDVEVNHRSWFGRDRECAEFDGVTVFVGGGDAVLAFPSRAGDLVGAVQFARESGAREVGCWALAPDEALGARLTALGFQDGWEPQWMGMDVAESLGEPACPVSETTECAPELPYSSLAHESVLGGDVHHFVVGDEVSVVGHAVLNVEGESGAIYDMGVVRRAQRRGYGRALTIAALAQSRHSGCMTLTLNATGEGEPLYENVGFVALGRGMTWWLFPRT